ncbi:GUN4 domain-containing protein [Anabaena azotica]|uniref:GUN4 domain-containing protein n=1 Tax=Anabaena azotica TaxID=197653 RepID=UPI0039A7220A
MQLKSVVGMDYSILRDLLIAGKWKEADEETKRVMLCVGKREEDGWLDTGIIDNFPCEDLLTIDNLWVKYSNERFGFSVQKKIYEGLGGRGRSMDYHLTILEDFGEKVGWKKEGNWLYYADITFDITAPKGHLPVEVLWMEYEVWRLFFAMTGVSSLTSRLAECQI